VIGSRDHHVTPRGILTLLVHPPPSDLSNWGPSIPSTPCSFREHLTVSKRRPVSIYDSQNLRSLNKTHLWHLISPTFCSAHHLLQYECLFNFLAQKMDFRPITWRHVTYKGSDLNDFYFILNYSLIPFIWAVNQLCISKNVEVTIFNV